MHNYIQNLRVPSYLPILLCGRMHRSSLEIDRGQTALWSYSISGDLPIVLLQIQDIANIELARQMVQAHAYWRLKGLMVDLVIWNEDYGGYRQALQNELLSLISPGIITDVKDKPGGIFIRSGEQVSQEDRILFQAVSTDHTVRYFWDTG